jgi:hypothetical protein
VGIIEMPSHGRVNGSEISPVAEPVATAIQEFDAQRLRQEVLAMLFGRLEPAQDLMMREDDAIKREGDRDG